MPESKAKLAQPVEAEAPARLKASGKGVAASTILSWLVQTQFFNVCVCFDTNHMTMLIARALVVCGWPLQAACQHCASLLAEACLMRVVAASHS